MAHPTEILKERFILGKSVNCEASRLPESSCLMVGVTRYGISEYPYENTRKHIVQFL